MADPLTIAAIGWGLTAANWLISPVLSRLIAQCFRTLGEDIPEKLRHLETTLLPQLEIIMEAAQHSPHRSKLEKWLQNLKDAFYEAEDMLDLVEYERREREVKSESSSRILSSLPRPFSTQKKKLSKSLQKLEKLVNEAIRDIVTLFQLPSLRYNNVITASSSKNPYRETTASPPPLVIGRDEDRDHIIKMLHEDSIESSRSGFGRECFSVIGVYGVGGSGKTTLAQYICQKEKNDNYFDLVMWIYVSQEFDVRTILSKILESVCRQSSGDFKTLDVLQNKIEKELSGKKYLLVLDDVWNKDVIFDKLDQLFAPLRVGQGGSKILVTTRMEDVAKNLGSPNPIKLKELDDEQFLRLLMHYALGGALTDNLKKELKIIGEKIAAKLHRSPLAARIVAGRLFKRPDPTFWSNMLSQDLLKDTMGVLYLSYQHLDPNLQRCFAFCSLFPKGYMFYDDKLLEYWIAEQFIENNHGNEHVRDVYLKYSNLGALF